MVEAKLRTMAADLCCMEESQVKMDSNFLDDLGFDSLDIVEFIMMVEEEFDIEIADDDANKLDTFEQAVRYVNERLA